MKSKDFEIEILNEQRVLRVDRKRMREMIRFVLTGEGAKRRGVNVLFCTDAFIRKFNRRYFGKDRATDVIAFGAGKGTLPGEKNLLGEIVVSAERAAKAAGAYEATPQEELRRYVIHGTLHLLGYTDASVMGNKKMHRVQENYLKTESKNRIRNRKKLPSAKKSGKPGGIK